MKLRVLWLEVLTGYQERMEYGMPSFVKNGAGEVLFASQLIKKTDLPYTIQQVCLFIETG